MWKSMKQSIHSPTSHLEHIVLIIDLHLSPEHLFLLFPDVFFTKWLIVSYLRVFKTLEVDVSG